MKKISELQVNNYFQISNENKNTKIYYVEKVYKKSIHLRDSNTLEIKIYLISEVIFQYNNIHYEIMLLSIDQGRLAFRLQIQKNIELKEQILIELQSESQEVQEESKNIIKTLKKNIITLENLKRKLLIN